jgi:hypothetical protein
MNPFFKKNSSIFLNMISSRLQNGQLKFDNINVEYGFTFKIHSQSKKKIVIPLILFSSYLTHIMI